MNTRTIIIATAVGLMATFAVPAKADHGDLAVALQLGSTYIHFVDHGHYYYAPRRYVHDRRYWRKYDRRHHRNFHRHAEYRHVRWHRYSDLRRDRYYGDDHRRYRGKAKRKHRRHHREH